MATTTRTFTVTIDRSADDLASKTVTVKVEVTTFLVFWELTSQEDGYPVVVLDDQAIRRTDDAAKRMADGIRCHLDWIAGLSPRRAAAMAKKAAALAA